MSGTIRFPNGRSPLRKRSWQPKAEPRLMLQSERLEDRLAPADLNWTTPVYFGSHTTSAVAFGDVDADRKTDAVLAIGSQFYVYTNQSSGSLVHSFQVFEPGTQGALRFALADTTGDRRADLHIQATINGRRETRFYDATQLVGTSPPVTPPTGTFTSSGSVVEGRGGSVSFANVAGGSGGYLFSYDFNNDGKFEVSNSTAASARVPTSFLPDGPASHTVRGRVTDSSGRFTDHTTTIQVTNVAPTAKVSGPSTAEAGKAVVFSASATDPSAADQAAGFKYAWSFGDGTTGTGANPSHTYTTAGNYTVTVRATDKDGATSAPATTTLTVTLVAPPAGTFTNGGPVLEGSTGKVSFANVAGGSGGYLFSYDFNNDGKFEIANTTAATATVPASFLADGPFSRVVSGRVIDSNGRFTDYTTTIQVNNVAPTAKVSGPGTADAGKAVAFSASATDPSSADQAAGFTFAWTFGDGTTGTGANPSHTFASAGTYTVSVRATDRDGAASAPVSLTVSVKSDTQVSPPTATFGNGGPVNEGSTGSVSFSNVTGGSGGYVFSYDFDNNGTFEVAGSSTASATVPASFLPDGPATRTVRGRVTDDGGRFTDYTTAIQVNNVAPTAKASGPGVSTAGKSAAFSASATDPSPTDQAAGFTYAWNFGDGSTGSGANPSHKYSTPGTYTVTLRATDRNGATSAAATTSLTVVDGNSESGVVVTPDWIITHHDKMPNFGGHPTLVAVQSGNWSNPATWGGRLPAEGEIVNIGSGVTVTFDQVNEVELDTVSVLAGGKLQFRTDASTRLRVTNLLVLENGALVVGTAADPVRPGVKAEIWINDVPIDTARDADQFGHGLIGFGKIQIHGAVLSDTWVKLASEPRVGSTMLSLSTPVTGWRAGDRITLPDTRQLYWATQPDDPNGTFVPEWETATIAAISADGLTITLSAPLAYDHLGARAVDGSLTFLPHVSNLTRNVLIKSEDNFGTRGHTLFTARADVDIRYAQFAGLGRSKINTWDNTTRDNSGNVTHVGTNQQGRYPVNFHHLVGPATPPATGHQFTFEGNSVVCLMNSFEFRWGIAVKDSHYGAIRDNVVYNWAGAGIAVEDAGSSYNLIEGNSVSRVADMDVKPLHRRADDRGMADVAHEGTGIWFRGPNNYVRNNVVSNAGFGFTYWMFPVNEVRIPAYQGADPTQVGQSATVDATNQPLLAFEGNEVYGGLAHVGLTIWSLGTYGNGAHADARESVVKDFKVWHVYRAGYYGYETNRLTLDGFVFRGDWQNMVRTGQGPQGVLGVDYFQKDFTICNSDIQGAMVGFMPSFYSGDGTQTIENSVLKNYINLNFEHLTRSTFTAEHMPPRTTVVRDVIFGSLPGLESQVQYLGPQVDFRMVDRLTFDVQNYIQSDKVFVYNYNRVQGDDFRVYYAGQAADAIVPTSIYNTAPGQEGTTRITGSPVEGLTNADTWAQFGIAVAGEVAPTGSTTRARISGLYKAL